MNLDEFRLPSRQLQLPTRGPKFMYSYVSPEYYYVVENQKYTMNYPTKNNRNTDYANLTA